ncbi:MAG: DUF1667 domain-containing protein [Candidatus Margulisbacteria bacterium]|nr:DUF1667 domain-containing protein [Candidatus Margulisiibacteriota bacterium]
MIRKMTCIDCPVGCQLEVEVEGGQVIKVTGNKCEKGLTYARQEVERPLRILTTTVLTSGLNVKMVPVRTNKPIPKDRLLAAMAAVRQVRLDHPVKVGETIVKDILNLDTDLIATREAF